MTERVPSAYPLFSSSAAKIGVIASSSGFALPAMNGANYLAGYRLNSLIYWNSFESVTSEGIDGEMLLYTTRHSNCDAIAMVCGLASVSASPSITLKAGSAGTTETFTPTNISRMMTYDGLFSEWDSGASGDQEINVTFTNCTTDYIMLWNLQRATMSSGDSFAQRVDETYYQAGLVAPKYIIDGSTDSKIKAILSTIQTAKDNNKPQAMSWTYPGMDKTINAGSWAQVTEAPVFTFRAKQYKSESTRTYRVYVNAWFDGNPATDSFDWRLRSTSSGNSASQTGLVSTTAAWTNDTVAVDSTADDTFVFEAQTALGTDDIHIHSVCVYED